jgi:hypothetical protein
VKSIREIGERIDRALVALAQGGRYIVSEVDCQLLRNLGYIELIAKKWCLTNLGDVRLQGARTRALAQERRP